MSFSYFDESFFQQFTTTRARLMLYKENPNRSFVVGIVREVICTETHIHNFVHIMRARGGNVLLVKSNENFNLFTVHDDKEQVGELVFYK